MRSVFAAFRFLTCIPFPGNGRLESKQLGSSSAWFPLVGFCIGIILSVTGKCLGYFFVPMATAALLLALWTALSGGLHMDGLMDTADGLYGSRETERALEIMRDSRVGAMGVTAAIIVVILKWAFLTSLLERIGEGGINEWMRLAVIPAMGRWAMVYLLFVYPYARREGGLAQPFSTETKKGQFFISSLTVLMLCLLSKRPELWLAWAAAFLTAAFAGWRVSKRLGGITGDVCGAVNELTEALALLAVIAC